MVKNVKEPSTNERLNRLEEGIRRIDRWMEIQDEQIKGFIDEKKKDRKDLGEIDKKTSEAKKEIVAFTFELISMIVGFLKSVSIGASDSSPPL